MTQHNLIQEQSPQVHCHEYLNICALRDTSHEGEKEVFVMRDLGYQNAGSL